MWGNSNDTTGNLLDYLYHQNYYELIGIDLSRQLNTSIHHQSNLIEKSKADDGATIIFTAEKQQKIL